MFPLSHCFHHGDQRQSKLFAAVSGKFVRHRPLRRAISLIVFHRTHFVHSKGHRGCLGPGASADSNRISRGTNHLNQLHVDRVRAPRRGDELSEGLTPFVRNVHGGRAPEHSSDGRPADLKSRLAEKLFVAGVSTAV
jgi:hypothetical protein